MLPQKKLTCRRPPKVDTAVIETKHVEFQLELWQLIQRQSYDIDTMYDTIMEVTRNSATCPTGKTNKMVKSNSIIYISSAKKRIEM